MNRTAIEWKGRLAAELKQAVEDRGDSLARIGHPDAEDFADALHLLEEVVNTGGQVVLIALPSKGADGTQNGSIDETPAYGPERADELLTQRQAAERLGVHPKTIGRWLNNGDLDAVTINGRRRIAASSLACLAAVEGAGRDRGAVGKARPAPTSPTKRTR